MIEPCQDPDSHSQDDHQTRRRFLRRVGMGCSSLGVIGMSSPALLLSDPPNATAQWSGQFIAESERESIGRLMRESEERLMRAVKWEMVKQNEEICERTLKQDGFSDGFVKRFLALDVGPGDCSPVS